MENIVFKNKEDLINYLTHYKNIGSGAEGNCYKVHKKTYKIYKNSSIKNINNIHNIENILRYKNIIIDNIYFVRGLIYCDNLIVGSYSEYAKGKSCIQTELHKCKINKLTYALSILKQNIYELSKLGICIDDYFLGNILYDGNNFKLIDTASYYINNSDINIIYQENMKKIISELFKNITYKYYEKDNFIYTYLHDINSPYKNYLYDIDLITNPDNTILEIKKIISEYMGYEIESFSNSRTKLLKRNNTI